MEAKPERFIINITESQYKNFLDGLNLVGSTFSGAARVAKERVSMAERHLGRDVLRSAQRFHPTRLWIQLLNNDTLEEVGSPMDIVLVDEKR